MSGEIAFSFCGAFGLILMSLGFTWTLWGQLDDLAYKTYCLKKMVNALEEILDIHEQDIKSFESRIKHLKDLVESKK